MLHVNMQAAE